MARQGTCVAFRFPMVGLFLAVLFFFCVNGWCGCTVKNSYWGSYTCSLSIPSSTVQCPNVNRCPSSCEDYQVAAGCEFVGCTSNSHGCQENYRVFCCSSQCEADSLACVNDGKKWVPSQVQGECGECKEQCQDSIWYHCESVFTENNVIRSEITEYQCDSVVAQRYLLGSCSDNGFCEGDSSPLDSCTYNEPNNCKKNGQNGSLCTYVCSDGSFHSCNIPWVPGQPSEYQPCPSKMPSNCGGRSSSSQGYSSSDGGSSSSQSSSSSNDYGSSSSDGGGNDCPECGVLQAIKDTLHNANRQRQAIAYDLSDIKNDIGDFGAQFNAIAGNTNVTAQRINTSNGLLEDIKSASIDIDHKLESLDLSDIKATVDSVIVHVDINSSASEGSSSSSVEPGPMPWVFYDLDSLPVWRDTVSDIHRAIDSVRMEIDSLNNDTTGVIGKYLPFLKKMSDKLQDLTGDCEGMECVFKPVVDSLVYKMNDAFGLDTVSPAEADSIDREITRLTDSTYIEGNWYCVEHPDDELCVELSPDELDSFFPPDTFDVAKFLREQDSLMDTIKKELEKEKEIDTLSLDELAGDSAAIRDSLDFIFLPSETLEQCIEFRFNTAFGRWTYNLAIDFADLFGLDLCDLIRKIVRLLTFLLIVITTVKGYIKAFGGGGPGGG